MQVVRYAALPVVLTLGLAAFGMTGTIFLGAASLLGVVLPWAVLRLWGDATRSSARWLNLYSIVYVSRYLPRWRSTAWSGQPSHAVQRDKCHARR
jgi:heme O synthase-like polyprenyltransferase